MNKEPYPEEPILIVDDDENFLTGIIPHLRNNEISNVECCNDSSKVMAMLKTKKYSIILLDIVMPKISGDVLLKQILQEYPESQVIMLTGLKDTKLAVKCVKAGAIDYIEKSDITELIEKLKINLHSSYSGKIKKIFISYSHHDQDFANRLVNDLKNAGMEVWIDEKKIKVGSSIPEKIKEGISCCHFFCVIISSHSVKSTWVEKECKMALNAQKQSSLKGTPGLLPILIQEVELPLLLKDIRCAEFLWNYDRGLSQILDAIKSCNLDITS